MTKIEITNFEKLLSQLEGMYDQVDALSRKNQKDVVNDFKLKYINELIDNLNNTLGDEFIPFKSFSSFSSDDLPSNSDVVFILKQYLNCMENLRRENIERDIRMSKGKIDKIFWYWKETKVLTYSPMKIK